MFAVLKKSIYLKPARSFYEKLNVVNIKKKAVADLFKHFKMIMNKQR